MTKPALQRQQELPDSIELIKYSPQRTGFAWRSWNPSSVKSARDLPPYLILGPLDEDSVEISCCGWSALWQGTEPDTRFEITYSEDAQRYEIRQEWCGIDGGFCIYSSAIPLDTLIPQALYAGFPRKWDAQAKTTLEQKYQLTYVEQPEGTTFFCGIPDGAFKTIAIPVSVNNMRRSRDWINRVIDEFGLRYPVHVVAKLLPQAFNYLEGEVPEQNPNPGTLFFQSLDQTGLVPFGFPVREKASDGTTAYTLRRAAYVIFVGVPFAGLTDLLDALYAKNGSVRQLDDFALSIELQPLIIPAALEYQSSNLAYWDRERFTRCHWQFSEDGRQKQLPAIEELMKAASETEARLLAAEEISAEVLEAVELGLKGNAPNE